MKKHDSAGMHGRFFFLVRKCSLASGGNWAMFTENGREIDGRENTRGAKAGETLAPGVSIKNCMGTGVGV